MVLARDASMTAGRESRRHTQQDTTQLLPYPGGYLPDPGARKAVHPGS